MNAVGPIGTRRDRPAAGYGGCGGGGISVQTCTSARPPTSRLLTSTSAAASSAAHSIAAMPAPTNTVVNITLPAASLPAPGVAVNFIDGDFCGRRPRQLREDADDPVTWLNTQCEQT